MTMYGDSRSLWWLFVRRVREDGVVYYCLPCEDTVRKHVFSMTCVVPVVSDTASGRLVFTVPVHTGTPGGWSPELKPCSTCCRSFFRASLLMDGERVQKNTQRGELFSRRHGSGRLCNRWHSGSLIVTYMASGVSASLEPACWMWTRSSQWR